MFCASDEPRSGGEAALHVQGDPAELSEELPQGPEQLSLVFVCSL